MTSYSVCWIDEYTGTMRLKSKLVRDHSGDAALQLHDQRATANMIVAFSNDLGRAAGMFSHIERFVSKALRAEHTGPVFVPDRSPRQ